MNPPNLGAGGPQARAPATETSFGAAGGGMMPVTTPGKAQAMTTNIADHSYASQMQMQPQVNVNQQMAPQQQTVGMKGPASSAGHSYAQSPVINNTANMYSQLEKMMNAVKKEAKQLEAVKQKIREMDGMQSTINELRGKLAAAENMNTDLKESLTANEGIAEGLRNDMQRLNDIYSKERENYQDSQQLNLNLQQEIGDVKNEVQFYQKEAQKMPELRKKNAALLSQIGLLTKQQEDEKGTFAATVSAMEGRIAEVSRAKEESMEHFWNLTEEVKTLKKKLEEQEEEGGDAARVVEEATTGRRLAEDRAGMVSEDQLAFLTRERDGIDIVRAELSGVKLETQGLRALLESKDQEQLTLHAKLRNIEEARVREKGDIKGRMASLSETISVLKSQKYELERENSEAQHRLGLVNGDVSRYTMEVEHLQAELSKGEVKMKTKEAEMQRLIDEQVKQRDDAVEKLKKATTNFEAMQNQARESQARYWEELQRVKEQESALTEEAEHLATELEEKSTKLVAVEAERAKLEEYMRGEVSNATGMTNALRGELERRLEELQAARKERDEGEEARAKMQAQMDEMKAIMTRQEATFQRTLENDRNKISGEIKSKMAKLRGLEVEKQELLIETSNLMKQVEDTQTNYNQAKEDLQRKSSEAKEAMILVEEMKDQAVEMEKRLKTSNQTEQELREHSNRLEKSFKEDISRLDSLVKESKKAAATQVLEISDRVKAANEEVDMMKTRVKDAKEHEEKAIADAERSKTELEIATKSHEDMQQQMARDMTTLRKELQDMRNKQKIHNESRTNMEMETMNARLEATKAENELNKVSEWAKEVEMKLNAEKEEARRWKKEATEHERDLKKVQMKRVELEEGLAKKQAAVERLTKDMQKLEREGLVEVRRMRVSLQAAEQEVSEMKPLIPLLQKELADSKSAFERQQTSTNDTVNGLLEELRNTEDTLSAERKKAGHDVDTYRYKLNTLEAELERAKEHIENFNINDKKRGSEQDMRVLRLEQELQHIKDMVAKKEGRVEELEKQRQSDRNRIHELKENLSNAEKAILDGKTTLELEQAQRRRVEARLKVAQAAHGHEHTASPGMGVTGSSPISLRTPREGTDAAEHEMSTTEKRTKMLYGDQVDNAEPAYDAMDGSNDDGFGTGVLDAASALSAIGVGEDRHNDPSGHDTSELEKQRQRIMQTGIAGDDDDFMAESANPPMQAFLHSSSSAPGGIGTGGSSSAGSQDDPNQRSPRADNSSIERMQSAIAARGAAEGNKASMKAASLQRQQERRKRLEEELAMGRAAESAGEGSRPGTGDKKGMVDSVRDRVDAAKSMEATSPGTLTDPGAPQDVEDSIQRTQMFLRQRLAQRTSKGPADDARAAAAAFATGDHGGEAGMALDAQELAAQAYERQRREKLGGEESPKLKAPNLSPARPMNSINGLKSTD